MRYDALNGISSPATIPTTATIGSESERFKSFSYAELVQRDKVSLDIFWLRDESLEDTENLPEPDELAGEIVANLTAALEQFQDISE